jgi:hypothetical protein
MQMTNSGTLGVVIHIGNEHRLLIQPDGKSFSFLLVLCGGKRNYTITACCIWSDPTDIAKELFAFLQTLKPNDSSGQLMYKMHSMKMAFQWTTE